MCLLFKTLVGVTYRAVSRRVCIQKENRMFANLRSVSIENRLMHAEILQHLSRRELDARRSAADVKFLVAAADDQKRRFPGLFADHRHQRLAGDGADFGMEILAELGADVLVNQVLEVQ